jgi:hypothetical protein
LAEILPVWIHQIGAERAHLDTVIILER